MIQLRHKKTNVTSVGLIRSCEIPIFRMCRQNFVSHFINTMSFKLSNTIKDRMVIY